MNILYTPPTERAADVPPPILYKYLDVAGAQTFLTQPQLRFKKFIDLDDICDTMPGYSQQTDAEARANAVDRVKQNPIAGVSLEHQLIFFEELGKVPSSYFEDSGREILAECYGEFPYVCSLSATPISLAMWSLYAQRHCVWY